MDKKEYMPSGDPAAQDALRDEANKPAPLYDKTDRNFQREDQGSQQGTTHDRVVPGVDQTTGSSSAEEKDII